MNFVGYPALVLRDGKKFVNTTRVYATDRHNVRTAKFRMTTTTESNRPTIHFGQIQHAGMLVKDVLLSKKFYMNIFGMIDDTDKRGNLPFPGAFLRAGASQIHLMQLPNPDPLENRAEHGGRDRHVAITVRDITPIVDSLERNGRKYTMSKSGRRAVFTRDLDANTLEFIEDSSV